MSKEIPELDGVTVNTTLLRNTIQPGITEGHDGSALRAFFVPSMLGLLLRSGLKRFPTIPLRATLVQQMRGVESKRVAIGQQIDHVFTLEITVGLLCPEPWIVPRRCSGPRRTSIIPT